MGWNKDGSTVKADYLGTVITGVVESSRVKYGGSVQYTVVLDEPVYIQWRNEATDRLLVDDKDLIADFGVIA